MSIILKKLIDPDWWLEIAFWICVPTVRITENSKKKWIRILGLLGVFILLPFEILGIPFLIIGVSIIIFEEI